MYSIFCEPTSCVWSRGLSCKNNYNKKYRRSWNHLWAEHIEPSTLLSNHSKTPTDVTIKLTSKCRYFMRPTSRRFITSWNHVVPGFVSAILWDADLEKLKHIRPLGIPKRFLASYSYYMLMSIISLLPRLLPHACICDNMRFVSPGRVSLIYCTRVWLRWPATLYYILHGLETSAAWQS